MMAPAIASTAGGCGGDSCAATRSWPLHHVRHRGFYRRLCSSCVLKYHPGFFCAACFEVFDAGSPGSLFRSSSASAEARPSITHCIKCPSVVHLACLPNPGSAAHYVCPSCEKTDGLLYSPFAGASAVAGVTDARRSGMKIDVDSAKVLLAAARLASVSMNRAAAAARMEAERKVKEAMVARKKAREMIDEAIAMAKERNKAKELNMSGQKRDSDISAEVVDSRKKVPKLDSTDRTASRERDKWMRFQQPIPAIHVPGQGISVNDKFKGTPVAAGQRMGSQDSMKFSANIAECEEEKKRLLLLQIDGGKKEDKMSAADRNTDPKK